MKIEASAKYLSGSPRKTGLVLRSIKKMPAYKAIEKLQLMKQKPAKAIIKLIKQAIANAKNNFKVTDLDKLKISQIIVNEGPRIRRIDKSHGARFDRGIIHKKFYHLKVVLELAEEIPSSPNFSAGVKEESKNGK